MSLAKVSHSPQEEVASISVPARVDYIFRFSRQVALVLGQDADAYLDVSHNCLNALSGDRNTAYIQLSEKLNDIQIRCRIVEQLFAQELFDPEKPLVETLQQLSKKAEQSISIVVEHGQFLSPQMLFELTQVNELGKRQKGLSVNILITASFDAKSKIAANLATFEPRIAVLSAHDGQIVPISAKDKKQVPIVASFNFWRPLVWFVAGALLLVGITVGVLQTTGSLDSFIQAKTVSVDKSTVEALPELNAFAADPVTDEVATVGKPVAQVNTPSKLESEKLALPSKVARLAASEDIFLAITQASKYEDKALAVPSEILASLSPSPELTGGTTRNAQAEAVNATVETKQVVKSEPVTKASVAVPNALFNEQVTSSHVINNDYYQDKKGFVIQYSAFTSVDAMKAYIKANREVLNFNGFERLRNDRNWYFLTSPAFESRQQAQQALASLPANIKASGAWIKSIAAVKQEIAF